MNRNSLPEILNELFFSHFAEYPTGVVSIPPSGSERRYWRMVSERFVAMGALNHHVPENEAFFYLADHFAQKGIAVPKVLCVHPLQTAYLVQDLGDNTLYSRVLACRDGGGDAFPPSLLAAYEATIDGLLAMQIRGVEGLVPSKCYPKTTFDHRTIVSDLLYFEHYFLRPSGVLFDSDLLHDDFDTLAKWLLQADATFFMMRDCQSRNVLFKEGKPYFIDFQGGRVGALQYDLVSLIYQANARIPQHHRDHLVQYYIKQATRLLGNRFSATDFSTYFDGFLLCRLLQVLGAYGYRGLFQRKAHFLESIPPAIDNLRYFLEHKKLDIELPVLSQALQQLVQQSPVPQNDIPALVANEPILSVRVTSFSYRRGIPADESGNGGGFVFDCRSLHNPGRYDAYKNLTGKDLSVQHFLETHSDVQGFLVPVFTLVSRTVETYLERGFTHLSVHFGCTGGRHRSVYCAEKMSQYLAKYAGVAVHLQHVEQALQNNNI
jgi:aminoglycoside/choline kinase family phosphotransferase